MRNEIAAVFIAQDYTRRKGTFFGAMQKRLNRTTFVPLLFFPAIGKTVSILSAEFYEPLRLRSRLVGDGTVPNLSGIMPSTIIMPPSSPSSPHDPSPSLSFPSSPPPTVRSVQLSTYSAACHNAGGATDRTKFAENLMTPVAQSKRPKSFPGLCSNGITISNPLQAQLNTCLICRYRRDCRA